MTEERATELLAHWDEIIAPTDCDDLLFWLSSWISDKEQSLTEADGVVSQLRLIYTEQYGSVAKANVHLEVTKEYKTLRVLETDIRRLKSSRSDVKRRYEIITNKLLQNRRF